MSSVNVVLKSVFDDKGIRQAEKSFSSVGSSLKKIAGPLAAAFSVAAITQFASSAITAAESAQVANNRLDQIATSMGIFGSQTDVVTNRLKDFADQQMMVIGQDDELIKSTQAKLLTFKELAATADTAGGAFDRATIAAFDLAAAGFGSAESNATQLGKALQDPIKGLTALARSGVTFTQSQKDQIATLVESNRMLEAQDIILSAIEQQVGGTAAATVTSTQKISLIFGELTEAAGMALLPAVEAVATQLQTQLVPIIQQFGAYLQSPEGTQAVQGFATAISEVTQFLISSASWLGENWNWVSKVGAAILVTVTALTAFKTALELAKVAQLLFNIAANANPYILLATAIIAALGLIASGISQITAAQDEQTTATSTSTGELNKFNNIKLDGIKGEINGVANAASSASVAIGNMYNAPIGPGLDASGRSMLEAPSKKDFPLNPKPGQVFTWFKWETVNGQTLAVWYEQRWDGTKWSNAKKVTNTSGGGTPPRDTETTADRFKKVQAVIKKAQAAIAAAERDYGRVVYEINRDNNDRVRELNETAAADQEALFRESRDRITSAFRSATQLSLGDLFDSNTTRELTTQVRKLSQNLTVSVTKETEKTTYSSVTDIIQGLRDRITGAKNLLSNASKLAGLGFKQTFIEQVLETGTESGNALAGSILEASPKTQSELRDLFNELETVSETGAGTLAKSIVDKFGLATREMKQQSEDINTELQDALQEQSETLTRSLADAAFAFQTQIADIKTQFLADLDEFDGKFAGLGNTIKAVIKNLTALLGAGSADIKAVLTAPDSGSVVAGATVTENVAVRDVRNATGIIIDELSDVRGTAAYLQARINAANSFIKLASSNAAQDASAAASVANWTKQLTELQARAATGSVAGTVVNINVRTDTTQSQAMVGKTIGNIVTKYVTTGGQVIVSGN